MNERRYILTIQNNNIFKEIDVFNEITLLKIGTLQECDVRLKSELFCLPICIILYKKEKEWYISCNDGLWINSRDIRGSRETVIRNGDVLEIHNSEFGAVLFQLSFSYDYTANANNFDTIIDIRNNDRIIIGNNDNAQIKLKSEFVGTEYIILNRATNGTWVLDASCAPTGVTHNGIRIFCASEVGEYDFIGIADYVFYYKNQVLYTMNREDMQIEGLNLQPLRDETVAFTYPKLNRSPRMLYMLNTEPIEILNPPKKPEKPRDNIALQLSPALLMIAVTVVTRSGLIGGLNMGSPVFLIYSLATMTVGILTSIMSFVYSKKRYQSDLVEWNEDYTGYIIKKRQEIESAQNEERAALIDMYPSLEIMRDFVKTFSGRLYERSPKDSDFLYVRAGLGTVLSLREISCRKDEYIKVENEFMLIPEKLREQYTLIKNVPVMLHLREAGAVGIIGSKKEQYEFFKNVLLDICVAHSNEEVQLIVLIPGDEQKKYEWIRWLPHINATSSGIRGIVCDEESRDNVFEYLYALMTERETVSEADTISVSLPYVVVFSLEEYGIKTHPLSKYAAESAKYGVSFIFFKEYMESLPQYCREIVELIPGGGTVRLRNDKNFLCPFTREEVSDSSIQFIAERLAPVYTEKIALSSRLTANITLFELLTINEQV